MATAIPLEGDVDNTGVLRIVKAGFLLAVIQAVTVVLVSIVNKSLDNPANRTLTAILVFIGAMITAFYPGTRTNPRTIEGIAGAAGIGCLATWVYVPIDAFILQPFGVYTNRWHEIGGFSIWWYLPVWWMVGTFISWQGGWILANLNNREGRISVPKAIVLTTICTLVIGAIAAAVHFPRAGWYVPTFAVAMLPGLVLANVISAMGRRRA
ncbi:MAG TPA: hypothetical protein VGM77_13910 [Gemmatimonadales bacterium]|jgi:hypothetical protein